MISKLTKYHRAMIATKPPTRRKQRATDGPPETAVRALVRAFGLLERVQHPYFARFGISGSQWGVLRALHRAEKDSPAGVRPPSVTGVVDRLERAGLVVRNASSGDLRSKPLSLTPRGRQLVEQVLAGHRPRLNMILEGLSATDQARLHQLLVRWGEHLEKLYKQSEQGKRL